MEHRAVGNSRSWLFPAALALVAFVAAGVLWLQATTAQERERRPAAESSTTTTPVPTPTEEPSTSPTKRTRPTKQPVAGPPQVVVVESLGIDAPVVPIATVGTSLDPPDDPQVLGWWSGGAPVGAARGTALVTGHTVNAGGGAMDNLEQVRRGAEIRVTTARGSIRYVAESVQVLDKDTLARRAQELFSQQVAGRLVLVTCEDWDGTGYRSNVVVTAVPA